MIISRTPVRISFFGGGTDYPGHYEAHGGEVLSTTIDQYLYITVRKLAPFFPHRIHVSYSKSESVQEIDEIQHPSVRHCLKHLDIKHGIDIFLMSDLPARTGLGSSSAFTVGLLRALHALRGDAITKESLAREAIYVEQEVIRERVGSQDQVAAAYGGFNRISFDKQDGFRVTSLTFDPARKKALQSHLMLFFTSISRTADEIVEEQFQKVKLNVDSLKRMQQQVGEGARILADLSRDMREFGELLHEGWMLKRALSSRISNTFIDEAYEQARRHGAIGGKLLGAGGGGFLLLFVPPERQQELRDNLPKLMHVPFGFEDDGTSLVHFSK
jgi:D-glycero-alpha-D-manno-heptose-7-phosphate kinase